MGFGEQCDQIKRERDVFYVGVCSQDPSARSRESGAFLGHIIIVTGGRCREAGGHRELRLVSLEAGARGRGHAGVAAHQ